MSMGHAWCMQISNLQGTIFQVKDAISVAHYLATGSRQHAPAVVAMTKQQISRAESLALLR